MLPGSAVLDRGNGRGSRVFDMHERPPAAAVADQRHAAMAQLADHGRRQHAGIGAVERSIAQHDAFGRGPSGHGTLQMLDRFERAAQFLRRIRIEFASASVLTGPPPLP